MVKAYWKATFLNTSGLEIYVATQSAEPAGVDPGGDRHRRCAAEAIWNNALPRGLELKQALQRIESLPVGVREGAVLTEFASREFPYAISATVYERDHEEH